jgi:hypothetical protein
VQPPVIMLFVRTNEHRAAAAARIGARTALRERSALMGADKVVLHADADMAAGREVCQCAGQRAAVTERLVDRRALRGPVAGLCAAAAEPGVVG